jgi:hypothetical protein
MRVLIISFLSLLSSVAFSQNAKLDSTKLINFYKINSISVVTLEEIDAGMDIQTTWRDVYGYVFEYSNGKMVVSIEDAESTFTFFKFKIPTFDSCVVRADGITQCVTSFKAIDMHDHLIDVMHLFPQVSAEVELPVLMILHDNYIIRYSLIRNELWE